MTNIPQIDKNVPLPMTSRAGAFDDWPIKAMKVGDSFLLPPDVKAEYVRKATKRMVPRATFRFLKTPEGIRCWRCR